MAQASSGAETTVMFLPLAIVADRWTKVETVCGLHLREHGSEVS